jgi:hypothetical protein
VARFIKSISSCVRIAALVGLAATSESARAHHSLAMYDGTKTLVFTGVVTRVSPGASHVVILFAPLDEGRQAVIRDAKGEPVLWSLELTAAGQAAQEGITVTSFPAGTIFSVGLHPLRAGDVGGSREGPMYKCPEKTPPAAGMHCDSVAGSTVHGSGEFPKPTD